MRVRLFTTLRQRVAVLLVSVLVPASLLVILTSFSTRDRDRREVQQEAYRLAVLAGVTPKQVAETTEQLFLALARVPAMAAGEPDACRRELVAVVEAGARFQNVGVVEPDGSVTCSARPVPGAVAPAAWLDEARRSQTLVAGRLERTPFSAEPTIVFAQGGAAGQNGDVFFAALNLTWLSEMAAAIPLPDGSAMEIVDDRGGLLARRPDHAEWVGRNVTDVPVIAAALARGDGVLESRGPDGVERLYGFHRVALPGGSALSIAVGIPLDVAYAPANARLRDSLIVLGVVAVVSLLLGRHASERLVTRKVDDLLRAARRVSAGDLTARTAQPWSEDELGELARTFDSMAWAVSQRTEELREMMESLRALAARLESVREQERTQISREIHDELGQTLTGIRMDLDRLEERIAAAPVAAADKAAFQAKVASVRKLVDSGLDTTRRISRQLRPSVLDVLGLQAGIEWLLEEFEARTNVRTRLEAPDSLGEIGEAASIAFFRILQEALTNIMRHAHATQVTVIIERDANALSMTVTDNGRGFEQENRPYPISLGLLGMRERAASLGGSTTVTSRPGEGTTVYVRIPVNGPSAGARA
jgi:signal transduction histidine kinase